MKRIFLAFLCLLAVPAWAAQKVVTVTPVVDIAAYTSADVMFVSTEVPNAMLATGDSARLVSVEVLDKSNQKPTFDLIFFDTPPAVSFGTINAAYVLNDSDLGGITGKLSVLNADYVSSGSSSNAEATYKNIQMILKSASRSKSIYIGGVVRAGTPTFATASDLTIRLGFEY